MAVFPNQTNINNVFPVGYKKGLLFNSGPSNYRPDMSESGNTLDSSNYTNVFYQSFGGSGVFYQFIQNQELPPFNYTTSNLTTGSDPILDDQGNPVLDQNYQEIYDSIISINASNSLQYYKSNLPPTLTAPLGSLYELDTNLGTSILYVNTSANWQEIVPAITSSIQQLPASPLVPGVNYQWTELGNLYLSIPLMYFPQTNQNAYAELDISPDQNNWSMVDSYSLPAGLVIAQGEISYLHSLVPSGWYYRINSNLINAVVNTNATAISIS
jgi:hypothetical protein